MPRSLHCFLLLVLSLECVSFLTTGLAGRNGTVTSGERFNEAQALIQASGAGNGGENIFYWNPSLDSALCIGERNSISNLIQICQLRSFFASCEESNNATTIVLDRCHGRSCRGFETEETTLCVLAFVDIPVVDDAEDGGSDAICGIPPIHSDLLEWGDPPWAQGLSAAGTSHCLTGLPVGTDFLRRMGCKGGRPRVQYRARFPNFAFLNDRRGAKCVIEQVCGGDEIYRSRAVCFEPK